MTRIDGYIEHYAGGTRGWEYIFDICGVQFDKVLKDGSPAVRKDGKVKVHIVWPEFNTGEMRVVYAHLVKPESIFLTKTALARAILEKEKTALESARRRVLDLEQAIAKEEDACG